MGDWRERYRAGRANGVTDSPTTELPSQLEGSLGGERMLEALPQASRSIETKFRQDLGKVEDPTVREQVRESAKPSLDDLRSVRKQARMAIYRARRSGDNELADQIRDALKTSEHPAPDEGGVVDTLKGGGRLLFKALDAPHHLVRQLTTKVFGDNPHGLYDKDISAEEWAGNVRKTEAAGGVKGALASAALLPARGFGAAVGVPLGAATAALGGVTDVPGLLKGERTLKDMGENAVKTVKETVHDATDLGLTIETDPLSYVSAGVGGASKTAGEAALRAGLRGGLERAAAEGLAEKVATLGSRIAGKPNAFRAVEDTFAAHFARAGLTPEAGTAAARNAFGEIGEFFGRGQLEAHVPFRSGKGIPIAPALGGQDFAIGKAIKKVADPVFEKLGGRKLFDPTKGAVKTLQREARGAASLGEARAMDELTHAMDQLPEGHNLTDPKVREQIERRHADPSWREVPVEQYTPAERAALDPTRVINRKGTFRAGSPTNWDPAETGLSKGATKGQPYQELSGQFHVEPWADYVPKEGLDRTFGPGAKQYTESLDEWHRARADELLQSGALKPNQLAANPLSGKYRKRVFDPSKGALEDVVAENYRSGSASSSLKSRAQKGLLNPEWAENVGLADREADYMKVAPQYAREAARASAKANFERQVIKNFGVTDEIASKLNITSHEVAPGVRLPADVYNAMRGTFDQSLTTIGKAMRRAGIGSSPAGRGVLKVVDAYTSSAKRFKGLVLKSPAYHAVNLVDDLVKMASAGMHNPAEHLRDAGRLMKGDVLKINGRKVTLKLANLENIGVDAAERFEQQGVQAGRKRLKRALEDSAGEPSIGSKLRRGYDKVNDVSNEVGQAWESRAKIAHWLWRLKEGDSPAIAAKKTFDVLIDYGDKSKVEQVLGWFIPFLKFAKESPGVTLKLAASNPGALNTLDRGLKFMGGEGSDPPQYVTERGSYTQLTPRGHEVAGNIRQVFGGSKEKKGLSYGFVPRLTEYEGLSPLVELAHGNLDPALLSLGPGTKAMAEMAMQEDLLTKKPLRRPDSLLDWFPADMPYVPNRLKADVGENPYLSRYLPPFLASPGPLLAANTGLNRAQGGMGPSSYLGGSRPYTGRQDPTDTIAMAWSKYFLGQPIYETSPADPVRTAAMNPTIQAALGNMAAAQKSEKLERKAKRRHR